MLEIGEFHKLNKLESIVITKHGKNRLSERKITVEDIMNAISNGLIIEQYEDDKPLPSCLVLANDLSGKQMHVVISHDDEFIYLITAYYPDPELWSEDFKTRKER